MELADEGLEILDERECFRLIETVRIGRVAIARGAIPAVFPVTFAKVGGDIMFFTGPGTKLDAAQEGRMVSFEVDEIDPLSEQGWSVLIVGKAELASEAAKERAKALGLYPWAAGERRSLVRIRPEFVSGRRVLLG
jgi:nitroimidazol reductase NimA-like FMN-containing flavoprotein (pyridoxamine 5'-phosphate oxidase superfamily)